jgi:hypothetical protein
VKRANLHVENITPISMRKINCRKKKLCPRRWATIVYKERKDSFVAYGCLDSTGN